MFSARQQASESASLKQPALTEAWMRALTQRERSLLMDVLAQEILTERLNSGDNVELRATGVGFANSLIPRAETFELAGLELDDPSPFVRELRGERDLIWIHNALQIVNETRVFLGACFSRLKVGGVLLVTVPHQFLFERKLTPPSRRDPRHRRFYTPTTLLSDIEEAIDPAEFRVRCLFESDLAYDYAGAVPDAPLGGQDIVLALERVPCPPWRSTLDLDDSVARQATAPVRQRPMNSAHETPTRMLAPDPQPIRSILVLKLDHRGDFILAQRAFSIMRRVFSEAEMTLACGASTGNFGIR